MNPSELRMMWMSHYNPERITVEDAPSFFGHPSVGLSVMDDLSSHQPTMVCKVKPFKLLYFTNMFHGNTCIHM